MTCKMAAGQQKKRLSSSNMHEQFKGKKKKKLDSSDCLLSLRPRIHLEWDNSKKRAMAKKEQIGITWTDMAPFLDSAPHCHSGLADVLSVPQEIFGLENLKEVLSYEVWATCLSESERKLLMQFLPSGTAAEQAVHSLLNGENKHFGNPFLKWSSSLCSGNLHPDNVLRMERLFRTHKKAYYTELNQYHTDMIEVLKKWKEKWGNCRDPEKLRRGLSKLKHETVPISAGKGKGSTESKKEIPRKICVRNDDTAKYMSYIKITKKQFELIKNLEHSGGDIQSKSLDRVIGDISGFRIQPYEALEKEENNRLHEHWLMVVNKDLPVAFEKRRGKILRKEEWGMLLEKELAEKKKQIVDKMEMENIESLENLESPSHEQIEDEESDDQPGDMIHRDDVDSPSNSHLVCIPSHNSPIVLEQETNDVDDMVEEPRASPSPAKYMWQDVSMPDSNYLTPSESHPYMSSGELSLRQPQAAEDRPSRIIDLERDHLDHEVVDSSVASIFYPYGRQAARDELLPPFPKEPGMLLAYPPHEDMNGLKQPGLQLLMSHQFQEQQQLIEQRQSREKEIFMHQVLNKCMYPNGRYPNQGHMPSVESNGGLVGPSWYPEEHRAHSGWSAIESNGGGQCLGDGGSVDGSLFSVLSECRNMSSRAPYDYAAPSEQFIQARSLVRGGIPNNDGIYGYATHQAKSSNGHEAGSNPTTDLNMPWLNYPHPSSSMHDPMSKQFLGSWKQ